MTESMGTSIETFENALVETEASLHRAAPGKLAGTLSELIDEPAVTPPGTVDRESLPSAELPLTTEPTRAQLLEAATGVTEAAFGIASYGTVVLRATADIDELAALFPDRHVVLLREEDIVADMAAAFERIAPILEDEAADLILATGPSATADMGSLVYGVHGPGDVHVVLIEGDG